MWLDSEANIHVSFNCSWFKIYQESYGDESVTLEDAMMADMIGKGREDLKMMSEKTNSTQVLHVSSAQKNIVIGSLLVKVSFKIVMKLNNIVITKSNIFIDNGFVCEGLFKLI